MRWLGFQYIGGDVKRYRDLEAAVIVEYQSRDGVLQIVPSRTCKRGFRG